MALSKKDAFALTICERRASREQARSQVRKESHSKQERGHEDEEKASGRVAIHVPDRVVSRASGPSASSTPICTHPLPSLDRT